MITQIPKDSHTPLSGLDLSNRAAQNNSRKNSIQVTTLREKKSHTSSLLLVCLLCKYHYFCSLCLCIQRIMSVATDATTLFKYPLFERKPDPIEDIYETTISRARQCRLRVPSKSLQGARALDLSPRDQTLDLFSPRISHDTMP